MAIQRCIARTLYIRGLGGKGVLGWGDFSCCAGGKRPQRRQLATPTAGPGQPEQRQARPRRRGREPSAPGKGTASETEGTRDKVETEGWSLAIIGVIKVNPVLLEFGLTVQCRSQPKPTNNIGVPAVLSLNRPGLLGPKRCSGSMIVN